MKRDFLRFKKLSKPFGTLIVALSVALPGLCHADWKLVWNDEFAQPDGSSPDPGKWSYDIGRGESGWGNNESEYYTRRTNNIRVDHGQLVIEACREKFGGAAFTSARIVTKDSWTYGRFEARIKIPYGQGIWPAFWMLGTNITSAGWPACGEIDIMENIGREPALVHGTIHGPGYSGDNGIGGPCSLPDKAAFAGDFHLYAVEWSTNQIKWFVDGRQYFTVTPTNLPPGKSWVYTRPHSIILNLAVGGNWPGKPDGTTTFPQRMTVDYIRVYKYLPRSMPPGDQTELKAVGK